MFVFITKKFRSTIVLSQVVDVTCEKCSCNYCYELMRSGSGYSESLYLVGQGGAKSRAQKAAMVSAGKKLARGAEPVPCPECGWFQAPMVRELRRRRSRPAVIWAIAGPFVLGLATLIVTSVNTHGFDDPLADMDPGKLELCASLAVATFVVPLVAMVFGAALWKSVKPNKAYPAKPQLVPGAPPATRRVDDAAGEKIIGKK